MLSLNTRNQVNNMLFQTFAEKSSSTAGHRYSDKWKGSYAYEYVSVVFLFWLLKDRQLRKHTLLLKISLIYEHQNWCRVFSVYFDQVINFLISFPWNRYLLPFYDKGNNSISMTLSVTLADAQNHSLQPVNILSAVLIGLRDCHCFNRPTCNFLSILTSRSSAAS